MKNIRNIFSFLNSSPLVTFSQGMYLMILPSQCSNWNICELPAANKIWKDDAAAATTVATGNVLEMLFIISYSRVHSFPANTNRYKLWVFN